MVLLVFSGALTVLLAYPLVGEAQRRRYKQRWSQLMLGFLGVVTEADLRHARPGSLLVANHISWLDIFVINALIPSAFVAKDEVRRWPVLGWLAAKNGTVFLKRGSRGHARLINAEIAEKLVAGQQVAVFPEGTTTSGTHVLHFHGALLQPALAAGRPVIPAALSYWEENGDRSLAPRYDGAITLGQSLAAILSRRRLVARLVTLPALGLNGEDRRVVATDARLAIIGETGLPLESRVPE